eukprot:scaffold2529_cov122-Isochrysis_galbana.AAC.4
MRTECTSTGACTPTGDRWRAGGARALSTTEASGIQASARAHQTRRRPACGRARAPWPPYTALEGHRTARATTRRARTGEG